MKIFENIYEMLIESRMTYGFEVWGLVEWGGIEKIGSTFGNYLDIGQGLVFQPVTSCQIARLIIAQCSISTAFCH